MDKLAIDVGTRHVGLCKWTGQTLSAYKRPTESPLSAWPKWMDLLIPTTPYEIIFRCTHSAFMAHSNEDLLARCAHDHGAQSFRMISPDVEADPSLAAARHTAQRHHLLIYGCVEIGAGHATLAVEEARRGIVAYRHRYLTDEPDTTCSQIGEALKAVLAEAADCLGTCPMQSLPLICLGGRGPELAVQLAEMTGLEIILIPHRAAVLTTIGMLLSDIVLHVRESFDPTDFYHLDLRDIFRRLMDQACSAITRQGYDLDDAVCHRRVDLCYDDEKNGVIELECDGLSDPSRVLALFQTRHAALRPQSRPSGKILCQAAVIRAVIETKKPHLPLSWDMDSSIAVPPGYGL